MSSSTKIVLVIVALPFVAIAGNVMQAVMSQVGHAVVLEVLKALR